MGCFFVYIFLVCTSVRTGDTVLMFSEPLCSRPDLGFVTLVMGEVASATQHPRITRHLAVHLSAFRTQVGCYSYPARLFGRGSRQFFMRPPVMYWNWRRGWLCFETGSMAALLGLRKEKRRHCTPSSYL